MRELNTLLTQPTAWLKPNIGDDRIIVSSRVRLARNLANKIFPDWMSEDDAVTLLEEIAPKILAMSEFEEAIFLNMKELTKIDKDFLIERHLISHDLKRKTKGSGIIINTDETVSIMINEEDHLRLQAISTGQKVEELWKKMDKIDSAIEQQLPYAFSENYGYLTSCPTNLGTGMRVSVMMHLPGLVLMNEISPIMKAVNKIGLAVRGLWGEGTEAAGNMFQISNQCSLGESESSILKQLIEISEEIATQEKNARMRLLEQKANYIRDHIYRAYGILMNAYMLSSKETLDMLSAVWLGLDLQLIKNVSETDIKELFIFTQPGHLQKILGRAISTEKRDIVRARMVKNKLDKSGKHNRIGLED